MTLTLTTITRDEALDLLLRGTQTKRAEIEAHIRDLRSQLDFDGTPSRNDAARAEHRKFSADSEILARPNTSQLAKVYRTKKFQKDWTKATEEKHRRMMSAATRKRMAEAQRARWAKRKAK